MKIHALNIYIGENVRFFRETKGMSQEQLAKELKMTRASIANMEAGKQVISIEKLFEISIIMGLIINHFLPNQEWFINNRNKRIKKVVTFEVVEEDENSISTDLNPYSPTANWVKPSFK